MTPAQAAGQAAGPAAGQTTGQTTGQPAAGTGVTVSAAAFDAVLFDLDGVVTDTAVLHREAWARLFDQHLAGRRFTDEDYVTYVDGKAREDGVSSYLTARGVQLGPDGVRELARAKDEFFRALLAERGPGVIASSVDLIRRVRAAGLRTAVVTASRNGAAILERASLTDLFDVRVDGVVAAELGLAGKPDPASFLEAARRLGSAPERLVVVEDSQAGVTAAHRGGFGLVLGLDRDGRHDLGSAGADRVVADLSAVRVIGGTAP